MRSYKVDSFFFSLVIIEELPGLLVLNSEAGLGNLLTMFEEDMDTPEELLKHLDTRIPPLLQSKTLSLVPCDGKNSRAVWRHGSSWRPTHAAPARVAIARAAEAP